MREGGVELGGAYELFQVFGGTEPPAVALSSPSVPPAGGGNDASSKANADGNWTVDATSGSLADGTSTFAGYRIDEELGGQGAHTAVGRTQHVTGSMTIDGTSITQLSITVDMTTLQSDDDRRDEQLRQRGLETDTYPTATFELTQPIDVGPVPNEGKSVDVTATGDLTLHGETKSVQVPIQARWTGNTIEAQPVSTSPWLITGSRNRSDSSCSRSPILGPSRCTSSLSRAEPHGSTDQLGRAE